MSARPCVLIVDDDEANLMLLEHGFSTADYRILCAGNGVGAMEALRATGPCDAIILDIEMPRMDGMTLLRELKAAPRYAGIPVVMQSSVDSPDASKEAIEAGACAYFVKPYDIDELVRTVTNAIGGRRELQPSEKCD